MPYVQTEEGTGPDYLFVDDKGKTKSRDTLTADKLRAADEGASIGEVVQVAATGEQIILRGVYETLAGEKPDLRWGVARLRDEIADWKQMTINAGRTSEGTPTMNTVDDSVVEPEVDPAESPADPEYDPDDGEDDDDEPTTEPSDHGEIVDAIPGVPTKEQV
jgi:hypothetical protein